MKKILIVEDEPEVIEAVSVRLKDAGYEMESAKDGKHIFEKLKTSRPDLIILDIMLLPILISIGRLCPILLSDLVLKGCQFFL